MTVWWQIAITTLGVLVIPTLGCLYRAFRDIDRLHQWRSDIVDPAIAKNTADHAASGATISIIQTTLATILAKLDLLLGKEPHEPPRSN